MKKQMWTFMLSVLIGYGFLSGMAAYAEDGRFVAVEIGNATFLPFSTDGGRSSFP